MQVIPLDKDTKSIVNEYLMISRDDVTSHRLKVIDEFKVLMLAINRTITRHNTIRVNRTQSKKIRALLYYTRCQRCDNFRCLRFPLMFNQWGFDEYLLKCPNCVLGRKRIPESKKESEPTYTWTSCLCAVM